MIIYKSPSATFSTIPADSCLIVKWQSGAELLQETEIQSELMKLFDYLPQHKIRAVVIDESDFSLQDKFDLKGWFEFEFVPQLSLAGIIRTAIIVPASRITEFQSEKVDSFLDPEFYFFSDTAAAMEWIRKI